MASEELTGRVERLERDFGGSMTQVARSLNELEGGQYEQGAIQRAHSRELIDIKKRLSKTATREDLEELRTQMLDSFKQMLAILDERLPKKEE